MKKFFALVVAIIITTSIFSQNSTSFFFEQNMRYHSDIDVFIPTTTIGTKTKINDKWSHGAFVLVTTGWAEVYYGLTYNINSNISLGLNVGIEQRQPNVTPRVSPFFFIKSPNSKISLLAIAEKGVIKGDHWWTVHALYNLKNLSFGLMSRRYYGTGFQCVYRINKHFDFWVAGLYDTEVELFKPTASFKLKF